MPDLRQVGKHRFPVLIQNLGADGNLQHPILAGPAGAVLAHAVRAAPGLEVLLVSEVDQRVQIGHAFGNDVAAPAAVAAVGTAELHILLAAKADAAGAAVTAPYVDFRFVEEFHRSDPVGPF